MHLDHLGIVTADADALAERYAAILDVPVVHEETARGIHFVFLDVGDGYFELLEPTDSETVVARFLDRQGEGMHHIALVVDSIPEALDAAREGGAELIDEEPRPGAWGHDIAFLHPDSTGGVLIEFVAH